MCGVGGFTGLGHLSAELRYDLVEALGIGLDKRGGHAAGAVTVPEEGQPRLMRKLGTFGAARGRFLRAAAAGHSVMMHTRYATTGSKDKVENAHPFAIKRKTLDGEERTVLYGCHNGMIHGTWETARKAGREHSVDSLEFFELLADQAYETIRALSGYGVVTFIRPEDRAIRVLRLTKNSDFHAVRLVGGGTVWGSTESIVKEAVEYIGQEVDSVLSIGDIGRVYRLSGKEAVETKLDNVCLNATTTDRRTSGSHSDYSGSAYGWSREDWGNWANGGRQYHQTYQPKWEDRCWVCGEFSNHTAKCKDEGGYWGRVVANETIARNWEKYNALRDKRLNESLKNRQKVISKSCVLCEDGTYRPVDGLGQLLTHSWPIYVKDRNGEYRMASSIYHARDLSGNPELSFFTKPVEYPGLGHRKLTEEETPKPESTVPSVTAAPEQQKLPISRQLPPAGHNGQWSIPPGLSQEEREAWIELHTAYPNLAQRLEEADLEQAAAELEKDWVEHIKAEPETVGGSD